MSIKKRKRDKNYLPLDDIKQINKEFLDELENVKRRVGLTFDKDLIDTFYDVLKGAYTATIELRSFEREVDYEIKCAEIEARREECKPWRRSWLWRLLFRPVTNRAQDIIEERAELDAERVHGELEKQLDDDWKQLFPKKEKLSKRELRRKVKKQLKAAIKAADNTETNEGFDEPATPDYVMSTDKAAKSLLKKVQNEAVPAQKQLPGQMMLEDVAPGGNAEQPPEPQEPAKPARRPRPPRSCRK